MRKIVTATVAAATVAGTLAVSVSNADAQWRRGWWGPGIAAGILGGIVVGSIIASRPPGYVVYPGYPYPVRYAGCYWAAEPVYNRHGQVIGHTGQPVQVCPGYY